jgi:NitT/TauT family transport system permease protein
MRAGRSLRLWRVAAPLVVGVVFLSVWEILVRINGIPRYVLPSPLEIAVSLWTDGPACSARCW